MNAPSIIRTLTAAAAIGILPTIAAAQAHHAMPMKTIVEVAVESGKFTTLVEAVKAAGLVETLSAPGPFTVFAPTDEAFAKLPKGTVEALLTDKSGLSAVLTFHVVSGKVMAADIVKANGASPVTVNGQAVQITVRDGKVFVNGAQVITADIQASNGVIHVIDAVLLPRAEPAMLDR